MIKKFLAEPSKRLLNSLDVIEVQTQILLQVTSIDQMKSILAADDDPDIREILTIFLTQAGYQVTMAESAQEFFNYLAINPPDGIILDINLPDMNGDEIVKFLRQRRQTQHTPIILISSNPDLPDIAADVEVDTYLSKPFDINELLEKVVKLETN